MRGTRARAPCNGFANKIGGFGQKVIPTGDMDADIKIFQEFYAGKLGKYPDKVSDIRFRDSDTAS